MAHPDFVVTHKSSSDLGFVQRIADQLNVTVESISDFLRRFLPPGTLIPISVAVGIISAGALMYWSSSNRKKDSNKIYLKVEPLIDLKNQTVVVGNEHARVSALVKSEDGLKLWLHEDSKTLYQVFRRGAEVSTTGECLGYRVPETTNGRKGIGPYRWLTYGDVIRRSEALARGFVTKGLQPGQQTFIGIYAQNRPEWIITEQACYFYSMVIIPLYDTLGPDTCSYIINQTEMELVVVDKAKKGLELLQQKASCPNLRVIVLMEAPESGLMDLAQQRGVEIVLFSELEKIGSSAGSLTPPAQLPTADDLATISYTSGTTGNPKGAMLTHGNIVSDLTAMLVLKYSIPNSSDTLLSFLPLAHMFERVIEALMFTVGGRIGYYSGDVKNLPDDLQTLRPTIFAVVPRVLNRIYDKVIQETQHSRLKRYLVDRAVKAKVAYLNKGIVRNDTIWDKIVFKRVREGMGGRIRLMVTGSAPLSPETLTFIRAAMGCVVLEGYGQTEAVAACTVGLEGDHIAGHVGSPLPCNKIKLVDVPDMNYFAKNGKGEVCIKGYNVFKGYYKDPEKTAEALDSDGWLHTGDIGLWTETGTLKIIDRKKHIFKLAQGEYIAPEKIENIYSRSKFVGQIFVHGDSLKSCLVAIVSPDHDVLVPYAKNELKLEDDIVAICKNQKVKSLILNDLKALGQKGGLQSFEQVKDIYLFPQPFTIDNDLLTPTMKTKRVAVKERFKDEISRMYENLW